MTAIPTFYRSATPTRDHAPIVGTDREFMAFLARRRADADEIPAAHQSEGRADEEHGDQHDGSDAWFTGEEHES